MLNNVILESTLDIQNNTITNYFELLENTFDCMESATNTEDLALITESVGTTVKNIIEAIANIFKTIKDRIVSFFKVNDTKEKEISEEIKKNPNVAKDCKITVANPAKLEDEYKKAKKRIENGEDAEEVKADFSKKCKLIAAGVGSAVVVSLGAAFLLYKKHKDGMLNSSEDKDIMKECTALAGKIDADNKKMMDYTDKNARLRKKSERNEDLKINTPDVIQLGNLEEMRKKKSIATLFSMARATSIEMWNGTMNGINKGFRSIKYNTDKTVNHTKSYASDTISSLKNIGILRK